MSMITISRGSFSSGKILAEFLARRLGSRCIDRDIIVESKGAVAMCSKMGNNGKLNTELWSEGNQHVLHRRCSHAMPGTTNPSGPATR